MDHGNHRHDPGKRAPAPFPTEITFKAIYKNGPSIVESVANTLREFQPDHEIRSTPSRNHKFVSFTITALFPTEEHLTRLCNALSALHGFTTMF